jgi:hypothetical protein
MKSWDGVISDFSSFIIHPANLTFLMSNFISVFRMSLEALRRSQSWMNRDVKIRAL